MATATTPWKEFIVTLAANETTGCVPCVRPLPSLHLSETLRGGCHYHPPLEDRKVRLRKVK